MRQTILQEHSTLRSRGRIAICCRRVRAAAPASTPSIEDTVGLRLAKACPYETGPDARLLSPKLQKKIRMDRAMHERCGNREDGSWRAELDRV
jgi:hypothetical protein